MSDKEINDNPWGKVIWSGGRDDEERDPIAELIEKVEEFKKQKLKPEEGETIDELHQRRMAIINEMEHKISDMLYLKRHKRMGS